MDQKQRQSTGTIIQTKEYVNQTFVLDHSRQQSMSNPVLSIENISLGGLERGCQLDAQNTTTNREVPSQSSIVKDQDEDLRLWRFRMKRERATQIYRCFMAILSTISISFSIFLVKLTVSLTASDTAIIKFLVQIALCLLFIRLYKRSLLGPIELRWLLIGRGVTGAVSLLSIYFSIRMINFADAITIRYCSPILTVLLAHFFLKDKLNWSHLASAILVIVGLVCMIRPSVIFGQYGHLDRVERSFNFICGTLLAILCSISAASGLIFIKKIVRIQSTLDFTLAIFYFSVIGLAISAFISILIYSLSPVQRSQIASNGSFVLKDILVALLAGFISFFGQVCFNLAIKSEQEASRISFLKVIDVLMAFLIEYLVLSVRPHWLNLIGAGLVLASVIAMFAYKHIIKRLNGHKNDTDSDTFEIRL